MITVEQYETAERELTLRESKRGWKIHAAIYAMVNAALVLVNVFEVSEFYWFPFPLVCWGIGLTAHYLYGVRWVERELRTRQRKIEGLAGNTGEGGVARPLLLHRAARRTPGSSRKSLGVG